MLRQPSSSMSPEPWTRYATTTRAATARSPTTWPSASRSSSPRCSYASDEGRHDLDLGAS